MLLMGQDTRSTLFLRRGRRIGRGDSRTGHEPKLGGPPPSRFSKPVDCQRVLALSNSVIALVYLLIAFNHQPSFFLVAAAFVGAG